MLQKCLPRSLKVYKDIVYYDGPILSILHDGEEFFIFYLADLNYDIDDHPYSYSYLLFRANKDDLEGFINYYSKHSYNMNLNHILHNILNDSAWKPCYAVYSYYEVVEWYDIREGGMDEFLQRHAQDAWRELSIIGRGEE